MKIMPEPIFYCNWVRKWLWIRYYFGLDIQLGYKLEVNSKFVRFGILFKLALITVVATNHSNCFSVHTVTGYSLQDKYPNYLNVHVLHRPFIV